MHDLRRQALESGKTVSRKARSRNASAASSKANSKANSGLSSPAHSRANSRNPSRHGSDDEDYLSDGTAWSTNSIDDILNSDDVDVPVDAWKNELNIRMEQIADRKRSSTEGRAESLNAFAHILRARYAKDELEGRVSELLPSISRSIKSETTERETITALKALAVTLVTLDSDDIYDSVCDLLKRTINDSESIETKAIAIHTLGTAAFFGGTSEEEVEEVMQFLVEIVESDGVSVDAQDEASVVTAALEEWGLLATVIDDLEEATELAIEAFVDQLQSTDSGVQIAAGENIALMYEKSFTPLEEDEEEEDVDLDSDEDDVPRAGDKMVRRYNVCRNQGQLLHTLDDLANVSSRKISKKDRKNLHSSFADIHNTVEKPTRGPKYSAVLDPITGNAAGGGRMKVKINKDIEIRVDKWWKLQRLNAFRRVLQGGFAQQFGENEALSRSIPFQAVPSRR